MIRFPPFVPGEKLPDFAGRVRRGQFRGRLLVPIARQMAGVGFLEKTPAEQRDHAAIRFARG